MTLHSAFRAEIHKTVGEICKHIPHVTVDTFGDDRLNCIVYYMGSTVWIANSKEGWVRPLSDVPNIVRVLKGQ